MSTDVIDDLKNSVKMAEAARLCRVSFPTITRWILNGKMRSFKVGHLRFVPLSAIKEFLEAGSCHTRTAPKRPARRSEAERRKASEAAAARSKAMGC